MNRKILGWILMGFLFAPGILVGCQSDSGQSEGETGAYLGDPNQVVASAEGIEIELSEVDRVVRLWKANRMPGIEQMSDREAQQKALDGLIDQKVLYAAALEAEMEPTDEQIASVIESLRSRYPSEGAFLEALGQQEMTEAEWRAGVARDMAVRQYLVTSVPDTQQISPEMTRAYYEEHPEMFAVGERLHARHILVRSTPVDETASAEIRAGAELARKEARERADSLLQAVRDGADFEALAREKSDCPSASRGGDLGEFGRGQMVQPFEEAAYALEPGQVSDLVESSFGFHIIRLEERIAPTTVPYDAQLEERLVQQIRSERQNESIRQRVDSLRSAASIERDF